MPLSLSWEMYVLIAVAIDLTPDHKWCPQDVLIHQSPTAELKAQGQLPRVLDAFYSK